MRKVLPKAFAFITILWAGALLGVSFIATPAKFLAGSLTFEAAIEVGRATFHVFNRIEWILYLICLFLAYRLKNPKIFFYTFLISSSLLLETFYLLPSLDQRIALLLAKQEVPASFLHRIYIIAEMLKFFSLCALGLYLVSDVKQEEKSYYP